MVTYTYETIPQNEGDPILRFEVKQRMADAPLTAHPETGQPVRRVISGGINIITGSKGCHTSAATPECCPLQDSMGCCGGGMCGMS